MNVKSATTIDFNKKTKKSDDLDDLLGELDNKLNYK